MSEHTDLPWKLEECDLHEEKHIDIRMVDADFLVACISDITKANAEYIVRACNSHDDLLAACKAMITDFDLGEHSIENSLKMMRAAIAKAQE